MERSAYDNLRLIRNHHWGSCDCRAILSEQLSRLKLSQDAGTSTAAVPEGILPDGLPNIDETLDLAAALEAIEQLDADEASVFALLVIKRTHA